MILTGTTSQMLAMDALAFEKMKSNRRKQRTPIRVAYDPKDPGATFPKVPPEEEFANGVGSDGGSDNEHMEDEENKNSKTACNTYPETFPMEEDLRNNASERHAPSKSNEPEDMSVAFPTKYHRLGSELFQESSFMPNGHNKKESSNEEIQKDKRESVEREIPNSTSNVDMTDIQNEEGIKVDGGNRIFHPDAYCEICDREFCNKYFLKTHKANKHGIFDNSPSPFSMGGMPPSMVGLPEDATSFPLPHPTPLPPSQPTSSSFKVMDFLQSLPATEPKFPSKLEQHSAPKPLEKSLPNISESINTTSKDDILSSRSTPTSTMMNNNNNTSNNKDNNNSASKVNKDMEDFCELCQKHFCNKYYLKKHKQDVHGITPPEGLSSSKRGRAKDLQLKLDAITSSAGAIPTSASPLIPHSIASMAGLPNMPGVMVLNPFMPPMLIPGSLLGQSQFAPPMMPQPLNGSSASQNSPPSSLITSTASQSSPIDIMRERMGGSGGKESFCQLCQKEFCNEHFLKIHKANKHGIYDDTSPESSGRMFDPAAAVNKPTANTSEIPSSTSNTDGGKDLSKPDSSPKPGTSLVTNSSSQDNYVTYCNLCNQEFASKYTYRIHRIQVHGMLNEGMDIPLSEEMIKQSMRMKEEAMKMSPRSKISDDGPIDSRMSENGLSTMFGNMVAAKLADRVTCEICNKDLCNKYFLKVHMFKVHGIEQNSDKMDSNRMSKSHYMGESDGIKNLSVKQEMKDPIHHSPKLPTSLPLPVLPKSTETPIDMSSGNASAEKLSSEELVKMGIDPEAYCEICKKEFCSKYFLRTHRLNIHGIRSDKSESPQHHHDAVDRLSLNHLAATALNKPLNLSMNGGKTKFGFEKHTWRWKEPVNSSRVSCEICNKELCNKYFLRTHKLRKHGILPSDGEKMSLNSSPTTSDVETYSNSSLPTDLSIHDRNLESPSMFKMDNGLMSSRSNTMLNFEDRKAKIGDIPNFKMKSEEEMSMTDQYYNHYSEVCHLCNRRFKSTKWLKAHIWKDHAGMTAFSPDIRKFIEGYDMNMDSKCCEICKVVFPSELSMQLHMIQEHNAKIALNTSPTQNGDSPPPKKRVSRFGPRFAMKRRMSFLAKQKFYSCSVCDYKSKWLNNVTSHEQSYHDILPRGAKMDASQMNTENILDLAKRNGDVKNFKCKTCGRKFSSAIHCHKHIREEHIRGQNYRVNNKLSKVHLSCKFCPFATRFSKQLRHHMIRVHNSGRYNSSARDNSLSMSDDFSGNNASQPLNLHAQAVKNAAGDDGSSYTLQSFQIENRADDSDFVTALVKMPVRKHISGPVSVTFLLTPTMDD